MTTSPTPTLTTNPIIHVRRIYAIGDCHGDLDATTKILVMAGLISPEKHNWIGDSATLVQTGDIVDRGPDTILLFKLFRDLASQAERVGGKVVSLLGNHEVMNMMGDLRYVDPKDVDSFGDRTKRAREWSKNGDLGMYLRSLNITTIIDRNVFVHGGISARYARTGVNAINSLARDLLMQDVIPIHDLLVAPDCPIWFRDYANADEATACLELKEALLAMNVDRMIVGHTPQQSGYILARCAMSLSSGGPIEPRVYVVDLGISSAYGSVAKGLLLIEGARVQGVYYEGSRILS